MTTPRPFVWQGRPAPISAAAGSNNKEATKAVSRQRRAQMAKQENRRLNALKLTFPTAIGDFSVSYSGTDEGDWGVEISSGLNIPFDAEIPSLVASALLATTSVVNMFKKAYYNYRISKRPDAAPIAQALIDSINIKDAKIEPKLMDTVNKAIEARNNIPKEELSLMELTPASIQFALLIGGAGFSMKTLRVEARAVQKLAITKGMTAGIGEASVERVQRIGYLGTQENDDGQRTMAIGAVGLERPMPQRKETQQPESLSLNEAPTNPALEKEVETPEKFKIKGRVHKVHHSKEHAMIVASEPMPIAEVTSKLGEYTNTSQLARCVAEIEGVNAQLKERPDDEELLTSLQVQ